MKPNETIENGIERLINILKNIKDEELLAGAIWILFQANLYQEGDELLEELIELYQGELYKEKELPEFFRRWVRERTDAHA